jgi:putative aldouronate transport system permease protein
LKTKGKIQEGLGSRIFDVFNIILFILLAVIMIVPLWNVIVISLSTQSDYYKNSILLFPTSINLEAYKFLFSADTMFRGYAVTIFLSVACTAWSLLLTSMLAYPLSKKSLAGKRFFMIFLLITMFFSGGLIPSYLLMVNTLHLKNNYLALILPAGVSVWNFLIMRTFFMQLPESLEESAKIDGANDLTILFKIIYPLSIPTLATLGLFVFVGTWNSWFGPMLYLSKPKLYPLQLILYGMVKSTAKPDALVKSYGSANAGGLFIDGLKMAMVVVTIVPLLVIYPFMQKYFDKGVMLGSVKG